MMKSQRADELGRRRDAPLASRKCLRQMQMFFDRLQNRVRVQFHVPHHFREHVPFDLGEGEENVFVGQQSMLVTARLFDRAVDDPLRGFTNLALRDLEVFYVHSAPPVMPTEGSKTWASKRRGILATTCRGSNGTLREN